MKKYLAILIVVSMLLCFASCGENEDSSNNKKDSKKSEVEESIENSQGNIQHENKTDEVTNQTTSNANNAGASNSLSSFIKPADAVSIDMTKDDPSNDYMVFKYDEDGRVSQCYYKIGESLVYITYKYESNGAQIYAFIDDCVVDDCKINLSSYDANKGFSIIDGYYFKGFSA